MRILLAMTCLVLIVACDSGKDSRVFPIGKAVFSFDYERVTELSITKLDASSGDEWSARLRARAGGDWEIVSAPGGRDLTDRRADSGFVRHLLDTIRTLSPAVEAPKGDLASYGLTRPIWALRWKTPDGTEQELRIGARHGREGGRFALVGTEAEGTVIVAQGAALDMLAHLDSFERLRRLTLATFPSDDVDEIELWKAGRKLLYAQRAGVDWQDARRRPLPSKVGERLEALTHLRIRSFVDEPETSERLYREVVAQPDLKAVFKDRRGRATVMAVGRKDGRVVGLVTSRPGAAFELHPESERLFSNP